MFLVPVLPREEEEPVLDYCFKKGLLRHYANQTARPL